MKKMSIFELTNKLQDYVNEKSRGFKMQYAFCDTVAPNKYEHKPDNIVNIKAGDCRKHNYIYQVKAKNCEVKLVKALNMQTNSKQEIIDNYVKYNKANRYAYIVEVDTILYAIVMTKELFKEFLQTFGRYSEKRNNIRIFRADSTIWKWANENI